LSPITLGFTTFWRPLYWPQWCVMGIYLVYLFPYVVISYYERYATPLLGVKVLLVLWVGDRLLLMAFQDGSEFPLSPCGRGAENDG
jgi:hypothetical protein